jgi:hypothetical protein
MRGNGHLISSSPGRPPRSSQAIENPHRGAGPSLPVTQTKSTATEPAAIDEVEAILKAAVCETMSRNYKGFSDDKVLVPIELFRCARRACSFQLD